MRWRPKQQSHGGPKLPTKKECDSPLGSVGFRKTSPEMSTPVSKSGGGCLNAPRGLNIVDGTSCSAGDNPAKSSSLKRLELAVLLDAEMETTNL